MKYSLLQGVTLEEFKELKIQESALVNMIDQSGDYFGIRVTLRYNPSMNAIGIFVKREDQQTLILGSHRLNEKEKTFVKDLYLNLEQRLYHLRLQK